MGLDFAALEKRDRENGVESLFISSRCMRVNGSLFRSFVWASVESSRGGRP